MEETLFKVKKTYKTNTLKEMRGDSDGLRAGYYIKKALRTTTKELLETKDLLEEKKRSVGWEEKE